MKFQRVTSFLLPPRQGGKLQVPGFSKPRSLEINLRWDRGGPLKKNLKKRIGPIIFSCCSVSLLLHKKGWSSSIKLISEILCEYRDTNWGNGDKSLHKIVFFFLSKVVNRMTTRALNYIKPKAPNTTVSLTAPKMYRKTLLSHIR